jgi:hypothetical protein
MVVTIAQLYETCMMLVFLGTQSGPLPGTHLHADTVTTTAGLSAALITLAAPSAGLAKPNLLDLPACSNFKQAGELQYCEVQKGSGASPIEGDIVVVDYTARAVTTGGGCHVHWICVTAGTCLT